jgi:glutaryl-CoA dehydrogenase
MIFNAPDFFNIDELLSEDEIMIRETVRNFVDSEVLPVIEEHYMAGTYPSELTKKMADIGLFGITTPEKYGGMEASYSVYGLAMQELERGDSAVRSFGSVQNSLVMYPINKFGTEEQKHKWLPKLASGDAIGCFGLTEPDFGSNPGGMITNAKKLTKGSF